MTKDTSKRMGILGALGVGAAILFGSGDAKAIDRCEPCTTELVGQKICIECPAPRAYFSDPLALELQDVTLPSPQPYLRGYRANDSRTQRPEDDVVVFVGPDTDVAVAPARRGFKITGVEVVSTDKPDVEFEIAEDGRYVVDFKGRHRPYTVDFNLEQTRRDGARRPLRRAVTFLPQGEGGEECTPDWQPIPGQEGECREGQRTVVYYDAQGCGTGEGLLKRRQEACTTPITGGEPVCGGRPNIYLGQPWEQIACVGGKQVRLRIGQTMCHPDGRPYTEEELRGAGITAELLRSEEDKGRTVEQVYEDMFPEEVLVSPKILLSFEEQPCVEKCVDGRERAGISLGSQFTEYGVDGRDWQGSRTQLAAVADVLGMLKPSERRWRAGTFGGIAFDADLEGGRGLGDSWRLVVGADGRVRIANVDLGARLGYLRHQETTDVPQLGSAHLREQGVYFLFDAATDRLIPLGGDATLDFATRLRHDWTRMRVDTNGTRLDFGDQNATEWEARTRWRVPAQGLGPNGYVLFDVGGYLQRTPNQKINPRQMEEVARRFQADPYHVNLGDLLRSPRLEGGPLVGLGFGNDGWDINAEARVLASQTGHGYLAPFDLSVGGRHDVGIEAWPLRWRVFVGFRPTGLGYETQGGTFVGAGVGMGADTGDSYLGEIGR